MKPSEKTAPQIACRHCSELHPVSFSHCPKTGRSLSAGRALVGRVIGNRYRILALIGSGGMGAVYAAEHLLVGRKVAVKRLHPELVSDEKAVARFQREARTAAATGHEHIVEVLDLGFGEDGAPFLVMEYLRGQSLAQLLDVEGRRGLEPRRACRIVGQALAALAAVHQRGIVHRDLKPDNIFLTRHEGDPDFVKVLDFGISKMRAEEGADPALSLTGTGVMLGTPFYMSPEQARGMKELDHRVDLFAAGVILYECLSGRLPFDGENYHQLLQTILRGNHTPIARMRPELDTGLGAVVERAIALEPSHRYPTAREMWLALVAHGAADPGATDGRSKLPPALESDSALAARSLGVAASVLDTHTTGTRPKSQRATISPDSGASDAPVTAPPSEKPALKSTGPRPYAAQSADWFERKSNPPVHHEPVEDSSEETSFVRTVDKLEVLFDDATPIDERPPLSIEEPVRSRVKASFVIAALDHIKSKGPIDRIIMRLDPDVARRIEGVRLPMSLIALSDYAALLRAAERELGPGDGGVSAEIGRVTADRELMTTHRLFMESVTPAIAVERIPQLFRTYHMGGRTEVSRGTAGAIRVEATELEPDTLAHALALSGFYYRLMERAGASEVKASVVSCRERGDASTITILRWR